MRALLVAGIALLSGCIVDSDSSPRSVTAGVEGDGLTLNVTVTSHEGTHRLHAVARNVGERAVNISSICAPVFTHEVTRDGDRVWPPQEAVCLAYGVKPFPPGATESFGAWWNETVHEEPDATHDALPGTYVWTGTFHYQHDEADGWRTLDASVDVVVD